MLLGQPEPVLKTLPKPEPLPKSWVPISYHACKAAQDLFKNTVVFRYPFTETITIEGRGESGKGYLESQKLIGNDPNRWAKRIPSMVDAHTIDSVFGWVFFSEESVKVQQFPPYMHKTEVTKTAYITAGSFDISKWFRPVNLTFQLWPGENSINLVEGEPVVYINFVTDKKVVFKQFHLTEEIKALSSEGLKFRDLKGPLVPLKTLYSAFVKGKRPQRLLKLIKENLLEE
jgi:hypothetical protein